jgi:hypothetical protein
MSNRTQMRDRLRRELGDTATNKVWTDSLLDDLLVEAANWYSRLWPMQTTAYRDVAVGQRSFDVPPGVFGVTQVECPPGVMLPHEAAGTTGSAGSTGKRQSWSLWGGAVFLGNPASGGEAGTGKLAMRVLLPWARPDPVVDWNGPEEDEHLLIIWASTEAWAWLDGQDQKRGRPSKAGTNTARYAEQLEREVNARRRAAGSRRLELG